MSGKQYLALWLCSVAAAYAAGRYFIDAPSASVATEKHEDSTTHTITTRTTTKAPTGETKTVTTIDSTAVVSKDKKKDVVVPVVKRAMTNVSLLGGYDYRQPMAVQYGIAVSHEIVGPITAGIWGMNNGTFGVSLGLNF